MFKFNKRNIISLILAIAISGGFLCAVLTPPSAFNFIPYAIHKSTSSGSISENDFIKVFDIFSAVLILIFGYLLAKASFEVFGYFGDKKESKK